MDQSQQNVTKMFSMYADLCKFRNRFLTDSFSTCFGRLNVCWAVRFDTKTHHFAAPHFQKTKGLAYKNEQNPWFLKVFGDLRQAEVMRLRSEAVREGIRRSYEAAFKHLRVLGKSPSDRCERIVQPGDGGAGISASMDRRKLDG